jgi:hypothetical protein
MNKDDKEALRQWRDECEDPEDKRLLRTAIKHTEALEDKLNQAATLLRAALRAATGKD